MPTGARRWAGALCCLVVLLTGCTGRPPSAAPEASGLPASGPATYLALGDSVAAGIGAEVPSAGGYVPLLAGRLRERRGCTGEDCLEVRNLAVSGATTTSLRAEQLPAALELLRGEADVRLVTVTVGGNDVFEPAVRGCARAPGSPACRRAVAEALEGADAGVDAVLGALADAIGEDTTLAVMAYYDPLPACVLAPLQPLAEQVLEGAGDRPGLNDLLRRRAREHGAVVVETRERLRAPADFVGDRDCLHPSSSGHARIADAFDEAVGRAVGARG